MLSIYLFTASYELFELSVGKKTPLKAASAYETIIHFFPGYGAEVFSYIKRG